MSFEYEKDSHAVRSFKRVSRARASGLCHKIRTLSQKTRKAKLQNYLLTFLQRWSGMHARPSCLESLRPTLRRIGRPRFSRVIVGIVGSRFLLRLSSCSRSFVSMLLFCQCLDCPLLNHTSPSPRITDAFSAVRASVTHFLASHYTLRLVWAFDQLQCSPQNRPSYHYSTF